MLLSAVLACDAMFRGNPESFLSIHQVISAPLPYTFFGIHSNLGLLEIVKSTRTWILDLDCCQTKKQLAHAILKIFESSHGVQLNLSLVTSHYLV